MGGRVAAHLAARGDVGTVVALAPWWVGGDGDLIPVTTRLLVMHGTADTWTDPRASRAQTQRAQQRGLDAQWVGLDGAGHYMVRRWRNGTGSPESSSRNGSSRRIGCLGFEPLASAELRLRARQLDTVDDDFEFLVVERHHAGDRGDSR